MALYDDTTFKIATGHFYLAPVATAKPADVLAPPVAWVNIGHTSLDNVFQTSSQGGDSTVLGTLQAPSLRTSTTARTETWTINLAQWDVDALKLYFGSNAAFADDWLAVKSDPVPTEKAFLAVFTDGDEEFAIYAQKAEIKRGDDWSLNDTTSLATFPITVTALNHLGADTAYSVKPLVHAP